jgi:hypothetical protein
VFPIAKQLADCVIPAEYGITPAHKLRIAKKVASELIGKLLVDLENSRKDCEASAYDATGEQVTATTSSMYNASQLAGTEPTATLHGTRSTLSDAVLKARATQDENGNVSSEVRRLRV